MSNTHTTALNNRNLHCLHCNCYLVSIEKDYKPEHREIHICHVCGEISMLDKDQNHTDVPAHVMEAMQEDSPALYAELTNAQFLIRLQNAQSH